MNNWSPGIPWCIQHPEYYRRNLSYITRRIPRDMEIARRAWQDFRYKLRELIRFNRRHVGRTINMFQPSFVITWTEFFPYFGAIFRANCKRNKTVFHTRLCFADCITFRWTLQTDYKMTLQITRALLLDIYFSIVHFAIALIFTNRLIANRERRAIDQDSGDRTASKRWSIALDLDIK